MVTAAEQQYLDELNRQEEETRRQIAEMEKEAAVPKGPSVSSLAGPAALAGGAYALTNGFSALPSLSVAEAGLANLGESLGVYQSAIQGPVQEGAAALPAGGLTTLGGALAGAAGLYQGYKLADRLSDESREGSKFRSIAEGGMAGAGLGLGASTLLGTATLGPGLGTAIGAGVGALAGLAGKMTASGKSKDQMKRDQIRKVLQEIGGLDEAYNATLADGSKFDYGKDGGAKLTNADGTTTRSYNQIDWNNPLVNKAVAVSNPLGYLMGRKDGKIALDMVSYNTNAVTQNAKDEKQVEDNARSLYSSFGFKTKQDAAAALDQLKAEGAIDDAKYAAFRAETDRLLPDGSPAPGTGGGGGGYSLPELKVPKMDKKRMNAPIEIPFTERPQAGYSAGVDQHMKMLARMSGGSRA